MSITLSWDLFIMVCFALIMAYSFIIGKNQTLHVIISTYVAVLTADAIGNIMHNFVIGFGPVTKFLPTSMNDMVIVLTKIGIFIIATVILSVRGGFYVDITEEQSMPLKVAFNFIFGFMNAGLVVSTMFIFISGTSMIGAQNVGSNSLTALYQKSELVQLMVNHYDFWFALPSVGFIFASLVFIGSKNQ